MTAIRFPVTEPHLDESDREHLLDAFDSGWISSQGPWLEQFERDFARFTGSAHALSVANGTMALHLALMALHLGPGDEVIVPTFTYIASANAVKYCGATPVLNGYGMPGPPSLEEPFRRYPIETSAQCRSANEPTFC